MIKRILWAIVAAVFFLWNLPSPAQALELDEASRTVKLNDAGKTVVVSLADLKQGQKIFIQSCSVCHNNGRTKTNPNVTLSQADLEGAFPARDNIENMVAFLRNPMTYDGETDISQIHPNTGRSDLHQQMRNLTQDDLEAVSGFILVQPNVRGDIWGGGKEVN